MLRFSNDVLAERREAEPGPNFCGSALPTRRYSLRIALTPGKTVIISLVKRENAV
jgi:hypothetical protein